MNLALTDYSTMLLLYSTPRKGSLLSLLLRWFLHHTHAVVDISHFLHVFRYAEAKVYRFSSLSMPRYAVIDRSSVLPLAAFQRAFRIVTGKASQTDLKRLVSHACMSHVMKDSYTNFIINFVINSVYMYVFSMNSLSHINS